jgi:hypothetical protein
MKVIFEQGSKLCKILAPSLFPFNFACSHKKIWLWIVQSLFIYVNIEFDFINNMDMKRHIEICFF